MFEQRFRAVASVSVNSVQKKSQVSKIATPKNKSLATSFDGSRSNTPLLGKEEVLDLSSKNSDLRESKVLLPPVPPLDIKEIHKPLETEINKQKNIEINKQKNIEENKQKIIEENKQKAVEEIKQKMIEEAKQKMVEETKRKATESLMAPEILDFVEDITETKGKTKFFEEKKNMSFEDFKNESLLNETSKIPNESLLTDPIKFDESVSELDKHIETLRNGDMSSRVDALVAINDLILNNLETHRDELQKKANHLADALTKVIIITFEKPIVEIPLRFAKYFLNVVHKVCCTKIIMRELNESSLFSLAEQILIRLLIDELEKLGEKGEGELMLKTLNGTMLRILEHCRPTRIFVVLIRLLTKYKSGPSLQKMTGLIIRCLLKLTKIMGSLIHQIEIDKLLIAMHEYLVQSKLMSPEDVGSKTIKTILTEIVKLQGQIV